VLRRFLGVVAFGLIPLVVTGVAVPASAATATSTTSTAPTTTSPTGAGEQHAIAWHSCGKGFQCGTLTVPVDYTQPDGATVGIAVSRHPATDSSHRAGSLVINFGGPGDPGATTLRDFVSQVPSEIRSRYDLVSFDPRGVGASRPVECVTDAQSDALAAQDPTANSEADLPAFYNDSNAPVDLIQACIDRNGEWLAQIGTRNVARDLDRLRAALGERKLDYLGYSYGTVIGAVYAQMFPTDVGRFVLDSPVDMSYTAIEELENDASGFEHALDAFLADCKARTACPFHSHGDPAGALRTLQQQFENGLTVRTEDSKGRVSSRRLGVGEFYTGIIAALYDRKFGWPALAAGLAEAQAGDGTTLQLLADSYNGRDPNGHYDNISQVIGIILCDDRPDAVPSYADFVAEHDKLAAEYPFLGNLVGSTPVGCDPRLPLPPPSETVGDVHVSNVPPVLIVGTTNDPATPYAGAEDLQQRIEGSRVLTFESTEHTAYTKSTCIDDAVDTYLESGKLPPVGMRCKA
jgi:pimeloyl-ACP methyl ester carboxylesterase